MKVAIIGATGMVGGVMIDLLEQMNLGLEELILVASERSKGKKIKFLGKEISVVGIESALEKKPDVALFAAGGSFSMEWAPIFAKAGTRVIDNSSAFRMDEEIPLVIPEINADTITENTFIISNPNCSTIQLLMALAPLHKEFGIQRAVISTYQSISGSGVKAVEQMANERAGKKGEMIYPYPIDQNVLPHCDSFLDNGYTKEEMKLVNETHKILDPNIAVTATAVRVPVQGGHSESVNVTFKKDFNLTHVREIYHFTPGIQIQDNPETNAYPMPLLASGKNDVFVGRLRRDESLPNSMNLWIVADNLRKGAALNAIQIMLYMIKKRLVKTNNKVRYNAKNILKPARKIGRVHNPDGSPKHNQLPKPKKWPKDAETPTPLNPLPKPKRK